MLIGFMVAGAILSVIHQLGMAGKIPSYGISDIKPAFNLGMFLIFALSIAPYASTPMGFALMLLCFVGSWTVAKLVVDVWLQYFGRS